MPEQVRRFLRRPLLAAFFLVLVFGVWSFIFWQNSRSAPLRHRINEGSRLLAEGRGAAAESEWREATKIDSQSAEAWELLGNYYLATSDWPAAADALKRVEKLASSTPDLKSRLALATLRSGDFASAGKYSEQALTAKPDDIMALKAAISVAERNKKSERQLSLLQHLAALQPDSPGVLMTQAAALSAQFRYDEALPPLNRLLKIDRDFTAAYALRGEILYKNSPDATALQSAEADFQRVLQLEADNLEAHLYLGRIYLRQNRPLLAIEEFETVGRARPYSTVHLFELSLAYRKAGQKAKADATLKSFHRVEQLDSRVKELRLRSARNPKNAQLYLQLAQLLLQSLNSDDPSYQFYRFRYIERDLDDVNYYLDKARQIQPNNAELRALTVRVKREYENHILQGTALLKKGNLERGDWHLGHAILLRGNDERTKQAMSLLRAHQNSPALPTPPVAKELEKFFPPHNSKAMTPEATAPKTESN